MELLDHHVHGVVDATLDRPAFELLINEGGRPAPPGTSHFDSPVGAAVLSRCGPLLGLPPDCSADDYLAARASLGAAAVNRRFLEAGELSGLLVETGHRGDEIIDPPAMGELAGAPAWQVARIERVAEEWAGTAESPSHFLRGLGDALDAAAADSVGFKTVVAYRYGFDLPVELPDAGALRTAVEAWFRQPAGHPGPGHHRLDSPMVLAHVLHTAIEVAARRRLPLQVHAGFGDTDLTLHRCDPSVFTPWVRELDGRGVDVVFLHCYPYQRQAGYLAAVYPNVYFDVGCMFHYTGASSRAVLAEALELAPWSKQLFSSDAFGLAEFVYLGTTLFRRQLDRILAGWVEHEELPAATADRVRSMIGVDNARRIYPLDPDRKD
jgi:hypothetical protein